MRSLFTSILLCCVFVASNAQEKKYHVSLFSDSLLLGHHLVYERPILQTPYFMLDNQRIETKNVKFFSNRHGYFANLRELSGGKERYALRIKSGKVNLYEEIDMAIYGGDELQVEPNLGSSTSPLLATGESLEYYVKGNNSIQKAKYKFLTIDLADNPESELQLKSFKKYRTLQLGIFGLGLATTVGSLFMNQNNRAEFSPITALGIIITGSAYLMEYPKRDALLNAVDAYNEGE